MKKRTPSLCQALLGMDASVPYLALSMKAISRQNHRSISSRTESQCARGRSSISTISPILSAAGSKEFRHIIIIALEQWLETIQQQKKQAKKSSMSFLFTHKLIVPPIDIPPTFPFKQYRKPDVVVQNTHPHTLKQSVSHQPIQSFSRALGSNLDPRIIRPRQALQENSVVGKKILKA